MTVWTANIPYRHHAAGDMRPRLWGDEPNELLAVLYGIGASLDDRQPDTSWENYLITPEQQVVAVDHFGVVMADYMEPRLQRAMREGDGHMIEHIVRTRSYARRDKLAAAQC